MICLNELINLTCNKKEIISDFVILLSPYAPYISEEIWEALGYTDSINNASWPRINEKYLKEDNFTYPISFNGKKRFTLSLSTNLSKEDIQKHILKHPKTIKYLNQKSFKKIIIIPNKIVNIVI